MENSRTVFHTRNQVGSKMELNSKEVEPPMDFYLSSLEEQVRCELLDSEARLTRTTTKDRVLLEINEDRLQHFLDVLHEKTEEEMDISKMFCQANAKLKLKNCHLRWQEEKSSYQAQLDEQRAETNRIAAVLKDTQDLLESARHVQPKTTTEQEMEVFKNFCQAAVDKHLDVISQLSEALHKAEQELKNGHLQWQEEKSSLKARQQNNCDHFHSQVQVIASIRAQEQEAVKQKLEKAQAFYTAQLDEQSAETNRIAAALKDTQDLLETERVQHKTTTKAELEISKNLYQARIVELGDDNSKLKAAFIKAQNELKNRDVLWQQEKSCYLDRNKKAWGLYHTLVKTTADSGRMEEEAKQTLQRFQADHEGQLEEQRVETNRIAAALKETQDLLETERLRFQEQSSLTAHLEKTCRDHDHAQLKNIATLQTLEEKATQMVKRDQASQAQLDEQRVETNRIAAALKETQDLLETEHLQHKTTTKADLEIFENLCLALAETKRIKAAQKNTEDLFETERFLWHQEKSSLLQATEDLQATEKDLQSQIKNKQKKKKKWFKLF